MILFVVANFVSMFVGVPITLFICFLAPVAQNRLVVCQPLILYGS